MTTEFNVITYMNEEMQKLLELKAQLEREHAIIIGKIESLNEMAKSINEAAAAGMEDSEDGKDNSSESVEEKPAS
jgi:hypothetical protein